MVNSMKILIAALSLVALSPLCLCSKAYESGSYLFPQFYDNSCPKAQEIVRSIVAKAFSYDPRMPASLLRLHLHDECYLKGCLHPIPPGGTIIEKKRSNPNRDSARGFELIEEIKHALEQECPVGGGVGATGGAKIKEKLPGGGGRKLGSDLYTYK